MDRYVATCKCILDGSMNRTRCHRSVPVAEWRISFGPPPPNLVTILTAQGHGMSCNLEVVLTCTKLHLCPSFVEMCNLIYGVSGTQVNQ